MYAGTLGQSSAAASLPPLEGWEPSAWIAAVWDSFVELWPKILGLQHAAAEIAATSAPGTVRHDTARAVVDGAAQLSRIHTATQRKVEEYTGYLGLGSAVVVGSLALAALALVVLWCFRRYDALNATLDAVQRGDITSSEAQSLLDSAGPLPDLSVVGAGLTGTVVGLLLAGALLWWWSRKRHNPDLVVLNPPPGVWSHAVTRLEYVHDDDGEAYRHDFRPGVVMEGLEDGSVRLYNPDRPIWQEF